MDVAKREKRVKRLKYEIPIVLCSLLIIPWIVVIILSSKIKEYKKDCDEKEQLVTQYLEQVEMLSFKVYESGAFSEDKKAVQEDSSETFFEVEAEPSELKKQGLSQSEVNGLALSDEELYDGARKVYLTFDDGPSANTADILDILKEYDVKATFFVIYKEGREYEELYRRIVDEGHTLGMHSCTHVYSSVYSGVEEFEADTLKLRNFLYMVTGVESKYYRFPGGSSNRVSSIDMRVFAKKLSEMGIEYFDWNVSSKDASSPILSKEQIYNNAISGIAYYDEAMILFHDTGSKVTTVQALPDIIEYVKKMDNTIILPISQDTNPIQHISVE